MHKNMLLAFGITILFLGVAVAPLTQGIVTEESNPPISDGNTLYVGGTGEGNYTTIQDAINDASDGDTVFVYDDSSPYYEHLIVNKTINLIGEDKNTTIIDGSGTGTIIKRLADGVTITGFTIQNGWDGISMHSDGNFIFDNIIMKNKNCGITQSEYGSNNIVKGNRIIYNGYGIYIQDTKKICNNNLFTENFIAHNFYNGIYDDDRLYGGVIATWNVIADNSDSGGKFEGVYKHDSDSIYHHNDFFFNSKNAVVNGGRLGNDWDDGSEGNYWDNWESNPGYPDVYIIPSDMSEEIDWHPSATRWTNALVVDGSHWMGYEIYILVNETIYFDGRHCGGVAPYLYHWDFGDGNTSGVKNPAHIYVTPGSYEVTVKLIDNASNTDTDIVGIVNVGIGIPDAPTIDGPTSVKVGAWNSYKFVVIDPDGDDVYYTIDWGDGNWYDELGPYSSGEEVYILYCWSAPGNYTIRARARDGTWEYGPWGTLKVTVLKNKQAANSLVLRFLERFPILQRLLYLIE